MDDQNVFRNWLINVVGNSPARSTTAITNFIETFNDLLTSSDEEIDNFVSTEHGANSGRTNANSKIIISPRTVLNLKAMLFELKDRIKCGAMPTLAQLQNLTAAQMSALRLNRSIAIEYKNKKKDASKNPTLDLPKLTNDNFDEFMAAFTNLASRTIGVNELPIDYLLRTTDGNYNAAYQSREEKLKACILLVGDNFRKDSAMLYSLLHEHIGTTGTGSNFITKYERSRNGYLCYHDIHNHFNNDSFKQNKASRATAALNKAVYQGDKRNFNIETYYNIMTKNFNLLESAGAEYTLTDAQKISKFEEGVKEVNAIRYCIDAKTAYDALPAADKTFDRYYNIFSSAMNKYTTMANTSSGYNTRSRTSNTNIIGATSFSSSGRGTRGRGRGRGQGRGRGRGRGRSNNQSNRHSGGGPGFDSFAPTYGNFVAEAKIYPPNVYRHLTLQQKKSVDALKQEQGWLSSTQPPPGFTIDQSTGKATPSNAIISAIQTASVAGGQSTLFPPTVPPGPPTMIQLPPPSNMSLPPPPPPPPTDSQSIDMTQAGSQFGRRGTRQQPPDTQNSVSMVSINGQPYMGKIYDSSGNPLN